MDIFSRDTARPPRHLPRLRHGEQVNVTAVPPGAFGTPVHQEGGCYVMAGGEIRVPTVRWDAEEWKVTVPVRPDDVAAICGVAGMHTNAINLSEALGRIISKATDGTQAERRGHGQGVSDAANGI